MLVKSKSVNNGVQKRKEERDYDSVLIGEEIQLGFRVFFWFRVLFVNVLFFSSLLLLLSFTNQLQNPTIAKFGIHLQTYILFVTVRTESISLAAQRNFDTLLGFIGCVYNFI